MNIYIVTTEFLNKEGNGLLDGGIANEYYKFAKYLIRLGHKVNVIVCANRKKRKLIYDGICIEEFNPRKFFKIIRTLEFFIRKIFDKKLKIIKLRRFLFLDGIKKFLYIKSLFNKIDIIQYTSENRVGTFTLEEIPSCIRIASYTKNFLEEYGYELKDDEIKEEELMYKNARFIFGPSAHIANMIKKDLNLVTDIKIIETPFLKSIKEMDYTYANTLKNKKYILFFGTIGVLKGFFDVAEIIHKVLEEYKDLYFVFVGKQKKYNGIMPIDYIKEKSGEFSDRIIYFDRMQHEFLYPIIQSSYCCLMPSRTENFSNTCLEAMGLGKIVIGTSPFFNQIITDNENGFLCEAKNPESIYNKIRQVLALSKAEKDEIEKNAVKRIEKCTPEEKTDELVEYYNYVINNW